MVQANPRETVGIVLLGLGLALLIAAGLSVWMFGHSPAPNTEAASSMNAQNTAQHNAVPFSLAADPEAGRGLYNNYCASCHGADGRGKKETGTVLNSPEFLRYTTDRQIWIAIAYGREGTTMGPALKGEKGIKQLTGQQISHIVAYIRSFQK